MKSRRDFLKTAATGAVLLGAQSKLGLAESARPAQIQSCRRPRCGPSRAERQLDEKRVLASAGPRHRSYTGRDKPVEAWKRIVPVGKVIGLKVNGLGGKGISTHMALMLAVCERLQQAGVKPGEIVVWESRRARSGGLRPHHFDRSQPHSLLSAPMWRGFEEQQAAFGSASVKLAKILTRECDMVINLPILKDHELAGRHLLHEEYVRRYRAPGDLHANGCNPGVADLNCIPAIREKVRFTIGDAIDLGL